MCYSNINSDISYTKIKHVVTERNYAISTCSDYSVTSQFYVVDM